MPYLPPESNPDRGEYAASFSVEVDGVNFSSASFNFGLNYMPNTNEGSLDDVFESIVAHVAAHPLITLISAAKAYPVSQILTVEDTPTEETPQ